MKIGGILSSLQTTLSGMSNQIKRLDTISQNIANAERTPDEKGRVYQRKVVVPKKVPRGRKKFLLKSTLNMKRSTGDHMPSSDPQTGNIGNFSQNVLPVKVVEQKGFKLVYNPSHPRADENGYVKMPDVNPVEEMVDLISATRTYEANVSVLTAAKQMAKKAMEI